MMESVKGYGAKRASETRAFSMHLHCAANIGTSSCLEPGLPQNVPSVLSSQFLAQI